MAQKWPHCLQISVKSTFFSTKGVFLPASDILSLMAKLYKAKIIPFPDEYVDHFPALICPEIDASCFRSCIWGQFSACGLFVVLESEHSRLNVTELK